MSAPLPDALWARLQKVTKYGLSGRGVVLRSGVQAHPDAIGRLLRKLLFTYEKRRQSRPNDAEQWSGNSAYRVK